MVSEHSSVYKHSWCVSIELHTNAAQLKFGDKKYNSICNFFLCSVLHLSYQKVIFHKCIWFATSRRFILRSFSGWGRGDHWNIVKMYWIEFFICSRFGWSSFPPHFKAKYVTLCLKGFCSSQVFRCVSDDSSKFSTRCTFRQGPWVLLLAAPLVLPLYHAVILVLRFCQHGYHFSGAEFLLSKHTWPFARAGLIVDRPSLSNGCLSWRMIAMSYKAVAQTPHGK